MSEHVRPKHESHKHQAEHHVEAEHLPDIEKLNEEALEKAASQAETHELKKVVHEKAKSSKEISLEDAPKESAQEFGAYAELKGQTYARTLRHVQRRLSASERTMSKVMHNKAVEKVSDGIGKTVARPSGILGGGIVSLLGSCILLYMSKQYGFEYNFFVFFALMGGGFLLGVVLELCIFALRRTKS